MAGRFLPQADYDHVYIELGTPRPCYDLVVYVSGKGFPLVLRGGGESFTGDYHIPGGSVRPGELVSEALTRLAADELGIEIDLGGVFLLKTMDYLQTPEHQTHDISTFVWAPLKSGEPRSNKPMIWVRNMRDIPENIVPQHGAFLRWFLGGNWANRIIAMRNALL